MSTRDPQTSGSYVVTTVASGTTYYGVYAQMLAPFGVKVSHVDIRPQNTWGLERLPGIAVFVGSNDGTTWTLIRSVTNNSGALNAYTRYNVNATRAYKYIRIIWNKLTTAGTTTSYRDRAAASEIKIFGTEEGDESVDIVHRSVPNKPGTQQNIVLWDPNDPASFSLQTRRMCTIYRVPETRGYSDPRTTPRNRRCIHRPRVGTRGRSRGIATVPSRRSTAVLSV